MPKYCFFVYVLMHDQKELNVTYIKWFLRYSGSSKKAIICSAIV